jgi:hypothetical protein
MKLTPPSYIQQHYSTRPEAVKGDMIDFEALYGNIGSLREAGPQARRQKVERAELLVPKRVPIKFINNLPNG